jgi:hypothetical protein
MRSQYLRKVAHAQGFYLVRCLYRPAEQRKAVNQLIEEFRKRMASSADWNLEDKGGCVAAASRLAIIALRINHSSKKGNGDSSRPQEQ